MPPSPAPLTDWTITRIGRLAPPIVIERGSPGPVSPSGSPLTVEIRYPSAGGPAAGGDQVSVAEPGRACTVSRVGAPGNPADGPAAPTCTVIVASAESPGSPGTWTCT